MVVRYRDLPEPIARLWERLPSSRFYDGPAINVDFLMQSLLAVPVPMPPQLGADLRGTIVFDYTASLPPQVLQMRAELLASGVHDQAPPSATTPAGPAGSPPVGAGPWTGAHPGGFGASTDAAPTPYGSAAGFVKPDPGYPRGPEFDDRMRGSRDYESNKRYREEYERGRSGDKDRRHPDYRSGDSRDRDRPYPRGGSNVFDDSRPDPRREGMLNSS